MLALLDVIQIRCFGPQSCLTLRKFELILQWQLGGLTIIVAGVYQKWEDESVSEEETYLVFRSYIPILF